MLPSTKRKIGETAEKERRLDVHPVKMLSKHTSKAASACEVKTVRCSPAMSLGLPYSLPTVSKICNVPVVSDKKTNAVNLCNGKIVTYVHVDLLAIAFGAADSGSDNDQGVLGHEIPDASMRCPVVCRLGYEFELESTGEGNPEEQQAADTLQ